MKSYLKAIKHALDGMKSLLILCLSLAVVDFRCNFFDALDCIDQRTIVRVGFGRAFEKFLPVCQQSTPEIYKERKKAYFEKERIFANSLNRFDQEVSQM